MALNAVHIRARSVSPIAGSGIGFQLANDARPNVQDSPYHFAVRRSLYGGDEQDARWSSFRTGEASSAVSRRLTPRFVKETALSNPALQGENPGLFHEEPNVQSLKSTPMLASQAEAVSESSLSQLYAQLARDAPPPEPCALPESDFRPAAEHLQAASAQPSHHHHRHRHDLAARRKSEWFVAKALNKLRHTQMYDTGKQKHISSADADTAATRASVCPSCGDALPLHRTPEAMAQHRQSITHRLGLNAPMSSASASEAPSAAPSEAPTPLHRSRSASPDTAAQQPARPRSVSRRRLSTAARWKKIQQDNVGYTLLSRMGWKEGMGLGVDEWKWQQLSKEKKKQKLDHVRELLKQSTKSSGVLVESAPSIVDDDDQVSSFHHPNLGTSPDCLQMLPRAPPDTADEYQFGDDSLQLTDEDMHALVIESLPLEEKLALHQAIQAGEIRSQDLTVDEMQHHPDGVMVDPIQVHVRQNRQGIGLETRLRRSRASDGDVEIRKPATLPQQDQLYPKRSKASSPNPSQYLRPRSRSTKHQRKLSEDRKKRDWLDLRASLS